MLIYDAPDEINEWVSTRQGGRAVPGRCSALGWSENGKIVAGLVFHDSNSAHCLVNIALDNKHFPIGLLKSGLRYVFGQLQLKRLTFVISESNIRSQKLCLALGAIPEATLRDADINGNLLIFALFPESCPIWSRLNGKISRRGTASPRSESANSAAVSSG